MSFKCVKIYHGLCNTFNILEHKPQRLHGLRNRLQMLGYRVVFKEVSFVNYCMVAMCDHEIFRCNLNNLKFSTHNSRDSVTQRAINAVLLMSYKLKHARSQLWCKSLLNKAMTETNAYTPKHYWPIDFDIKPFTTCQECVECCEIMVSK